MGEKSLLINFFNIVNSFRQVSDYTRELPRHDGMGEKSATVSQTHFGIICFSFIFFHFLTVSEHE